jgi:hypothetical protein
LNAVYGWARMLRSGQRQAEAVERALDVIERNADAPARCRLSASGSCHHVRRERPDDADEVRHDLSLASIHRHDRSFYLGAVDQCGATLRR